MNLLQSFIGKLFSKEEAFHLKDGALLDFLPETQLGAMLQLAFHNCGRVVN